MYALFITARYNFCLFFSFEFALKVSYIRKWGSVHYLTATFSLSVLCMITRLKHCYFSFSNASYFYGYVSCMPTGKRSLGRPRSRWEDNIRTDLEEICINAGNWVD